VTINSEYTGVDLTRTLFSIRLDDVVHVTRYVSTLVINFLGLTKVNRIKLSTIN